MNRQRLDSPLVYVDAHNVYYVKLPVKVLYFTIHIHTVSFMATVLLLLLFACHSTIANAAVALGATRVIYPANQKQVLLPVTNNDPASVYLIQS